MATEIGSKGLAEVNLVIPQGTTLPFDVEHVDEEGNPVDHTGSTCHMAFVKPDGSRIDLSSACTGTATGVHVLVPADADFPLGKMPWDLMVDTAQGETYRLAYGSVKIVDTYAKDE